MSTRDQSEPQVRQLQPLAASRQAKAAITASTLMLYAVTAASLSVWFN